MSEFAPNYRTKAVEVEATFEHGLWHARPAGMGDILTGAHCSPEEFAALFEPIPKPDTVKLPRDFVRRMHDAWAWSPSDKALLDAALAEAEREKAT